MVKSHQHEIIFEAIRMGLNDSDACQHAHVSREWYYSTLKKDKKFADAIEDARLQFKRRNLAIIHKAALKSWTASAWMLERKYPEEYALRQRLEHTGPKGGPIPIAAGVADLSKMNFKDIEKLGDKIDAFLRPPQPKNDD